MYIVSVFISWQERKEMHRIFTSAYFFIPSSKWISYHVTFDTSFLYVEIGEYLHAREPVPFDTVSLCMYWVSRDRHTRALKVQNFPLSISVKRRGKGRARGQINQLCTVWYCTWRCDIPDLILNRIDLILNRIDYTELFHFSISIVLSYI